MKKLLTIITLVVLSLAAEAQQDVMISQYMFNHLLINPAYAGSKDYMMATLLYRKQWVNFKGAPETETATIHGPLGLTNFGWGVTLGHDKIGVTSKTSAFLNASYQLKLSEKFKLGLGIRAGGVNSVYQNSDLIYWDTQDPAFQDAKAQNFQPNVGSGAYLYSNKFYLGISAPNAISYDPKDDLSISSSSGEIVPRSKRHYFATTGIALELNQDVVFKPSVLVKYVKNAPVEADFNLNVLFMQTLWVGASYRTGDAFVAMLELQLNKQWRLGYSYDFTTTDIKNYSSGTHEVMLGYDFGYDIMKVKTPRYF